MAAQGSLSSVFSCSLSPKSISKKKSRPTRSLDSTLMRHCGTENEETSYKGDITWNTSLGPSVCLKPVPSQSLSESERVRLQEVAFRRSIRCHDSGCHITIPKYGHKHKKSLRKKLDSLSKEKNRDKETSPQAFGIPSSHVIANDRVHKLRHDHLREEHSNPTELMLSFLHSSSSFKRPNKELSSSNSSSSSTPESHNESPLPSTPETASRTSRRGGVSVDCITDLDDNQSRSLEALQSSSPDETAGNRKEPRDKKLSLNPIYRQVPRIVDLCCQHSERNGLQTVGIFRIGSSKKRVRQLREEFDQGWEVHFNDEHCVHDVAALLKKFLRDSPDPSSTRELYTAFIHTMSMDYPKQQNAIQLLIFSLPPCNSDTSHRILSLLSTVSSHADDRSDTEGRKIPGNKMTSRNLATILGPNLLHKQKNSDKEFAVQSFAHAEESSAIISVVQRMIDAYDMSFMVPADLQNEVLISLLETDADVVEYLLRRRTSQCSESDILRPEDSFSSTESCSSSDSLKASSGEVSPYDNNSPVSSDRSLLKDREDSSLNSDRDPLRPRQYKLSDHSKDGSRSSSPTLSTGKEASADCFWDTWHELFGKDFISHHITGSFGDASECDSYGSSEGSSSHQGNNKSPVRGTQASLGVLESRPHLPVSCSSSGPHDHGEQRQPNSLLHQSSSSQSGAITSDGSVQRTQRPPCPSFVDRSEVFSPRSCSGPLKETLISPCTLSVSNHQPDTQALSLPQQNPAHQTVDPTGRKTDSDCSNLQTEKWHLWQMMSSKKPETLPESLVRSSLH